MADKLILEFQAKTDDLDKRLKAVEGSVGNVGKTSKKVASEMTKDLEGVKDVASKISPEFGRAASAMGALTGGVGKVVTAMKTLRGAIIATGIGALVVVIASIATAVSRLQPVMDAFGRVTAGVGAAIDVVLDRVAKFGQGLLSIAQGNFSEGIDQIKQSFAGLGDEMEREFAIANRLKKEMQDFEKAQIVSSVAIAKLRSEIERLNATYGDTTVSIKEQVAAQQEILKLREKISEAMVKEAREALKHKVTQDGTNKAVKEFYDRMTDSNVLMMSFAEQAQLAEELTSKIGISESGNEDLKEVANLIKAIIAAEDERVQGARRTNAAINGLIAQQAAARKKAETDEAAADKLAEEQRTKDQEENAKARAKADEDAAARRAEVEKALGVVLAQVDEQLNTASEDVLRRQIAAANDAAAQRQLIAVQSYQNALISEKEYEDLSASIDDSADSEREAAEKAHQDRVNAIKQAAREKDEEERAKQQQHEIEQFNTYAGAVLNIIGGISSAVAAASQYELQILQSQLDNQTISQEQYDQRRRQILRDQAENAKAFAIMQAVIQTAMGITQALGSAPPPASFILAAITGALGAVQIGIIASEPIPQFAKGVIGLQGEGTETSDSIHARLSRGESVMTAKETRQHRPILEAIRKGTLEKMIAETYVRPAVDSAMLSGFGDMGRSADLNGLTAKLSDHNIIAAMDRNRSATVYGLKMLADKLDRRTPKRGYA